MTRRAVKRLKAEVEVLEKQGCIERVDWKPRRGAKEIFFRAKTTAHFDDRAWRQLPATVKEDVTVEYLQLIGEDAVAAVKGGTFDAREDRHVSRLRDLPASWTGGLGRSQLSSATEHFIEHRLGEAAGEGVLLARVVAAEQAPAPR